MDSIGDRIREERDRLGFNQTAFGAIGGVRKQAQLKYEKGERFPGADYLAAIAKVGADVQYIVAGQRASSALAADEQEFLGLFRAAPLAVKAAAIGALKSAGGQQTNVQKVKKGVGQQFNAGVGTVTSGDITNAGKKG
ncbi:helix-turn-helix domain-containing protein [Pseudomonas abyssi]|uniref:Transcriptional regulator n=1 Tax=Pseudomonas abyssi TaxID=170540 RepID=A0A395R876_9PSED|nr:helix-turn-helix transcriptional regulator [Halopseudomonas gallaeciensis]RGP55989.1 transcriptional regulator [Halopseudomonas gallaeciensis]